MNFRMLSLVVALGYCPNVSAQFNAQLEKEILALGTEFQLDGFERSEGLDRLEEISPWLTDEIVNRHLVGQSWRYSHSVDAAGRQYRRSNAINTYYFDSNGDGYLIPRNSETKKWYTWNNDVGNFLQLKLYKSSTRKEASGQAFLGIHSITSDRLVLTKAVKSRKYPEKSMILFNVYFRR